MTRFGDPDQTPSGSRAATRLTGDPVWPVDADSQEIRLAEFPAPHPQWRIFPGEFGLWHAERDTDHGSDTHVRHQLDDLLDALQDKYSGSWPHLVNVTKPRLALDVPDQDRYEQMSVVWAPMMDQTTDISKR